MSLVRLLSVMGAAVRVAAAAPTTHSDPWARAEALVAKMTLDEKMQLIQGNKRAVDPEGPNGGYVGIIPGIERLGIPPLRMNDGPEGFRVNALPGTSTQWPSGLAVAHSWDPELFGLWGKAMGKEFHDKGANVQFGPGVNIARLSNAGRSFEYLSGEDPYLGYELVQPVIRGIQSQGVIANVKHYLDNNQEGLISGNEQFGAGDRHSTSEIVDERTQMELYWPPFEGAVKAGVLSVMCVHNGFSGLWLGVRTDAGRWLQVRQQPGERRVRVREQPHREHDPQVVSATAAPSLGGCSSNGRRASGGAGRGESGRYSTADAGRPGGAWCRWGGFKGWVCSDYDGTRSTVDAALGGLDIVRACSWPHGYILD
jgi:hypothetical protein